MINKFLSNFIWVFCITLLIIAIYALSHPQEVSVIEPELNETGVNNVNIVITPNPNVLNPDLNPVSEPSPEHAELTEATCLALNMYHETRGDRSLVSDFAVSWVVVNRVNDKLYPDTICDVILEPYQFSWVFEHGTDIEKLNNHKNTLERAAWERSKKHAELFLTMFKDSPDVTSGSTHYFSGEVIPSWSANMISNGQIGSHRFFKHTR